MKPDAAAIQTIRRDLVAALGPLWLSPLRTTKPIATTDHWSWSYWPQFYPFGFICDVFLYRFAVNESKTELIALNTDWVDLADWFATTHSQQQLPE